MDSRRNSRIQMVDAFLVEASRHEAMVEPIWELKGPNSPAFAVEPGASSGPTETGDTGNTTAEPDIDQDRTGHSKYGSEQFSGSSRQQSGTSSTTRTSQ